MQESSDSTSDTCEMPENIQRLLKGAWLTDNDIFAYLVLLKEKFPQIGGLEDPIILQYSPKHIVKSEKYIRIVICHENSHWVCIQGLDNSKNGDLVLYDSCKRNEIDKTLEKNILN